MRRFVREMLSGPVDLAADRVIRKNLLGRFIPIFASVEESVSKRMGRECRLVPVCSLQKQRIGYVADEGHVIGDIVLLEGKSAGYYLVHQGKGVEVGWFGEETVYSNYEEFKALIEGAMPPGISGQWCHLSEVHNSFSILSSEWGSCSLGEMENRFAGKLLSRSEDRDFLRRLATMGRTLVDSVMEGRGFNVAQTNGASPVLDDARLARAVMLQEFESLGAIKREYVIFCQQTKSQISMVESLGAIEEASRRGFKCFYCGRSFSDERIDQLVSLTPFGNKLIAPHFWMAVKFYEEALKIISDQQILWTEDKASDTIDFLLNVDGGLVLIVIKEAALQLDDAYGIKVKGDLYQPDLISVVTTVPPSRDVRQYLKESAKPVIWMTKVDELSGFAGKLLDITRRERFKTVLADFIPMTGCDVTGLVMDWYFSGWRERDQTTPSALEEESAAVKEPQKSAEIKTLAEPVKDVVSGTPVVKPFSEEIQGSLSIEAAEEMPEEVILGELRETTAPARSASDNLVKIAMKTARDIQKNGIIGHESIIQILLQEVKKIGHGTDGLIVSEEGLAIAATFKEEEGDSLAPYCLEAVRLLIPEEKVLGEEEAVSVIIGSANRQLRLYPCNQFILGVFSPFTVKQSKKQPPNLSHIPIEMHLSAVVAELLSLQVFTTVFATKEGDIISNVGPARESITLTERGTSIVSKLSGWGNKILGEKLKFVEWEIGVEERVAILILGDKNLILKLNTSVTLEAIQEKFDILAATFLNPGDKQD